LAARRAGITNIILPKLNEKDVKEVPAYALKGMTLHFVSHVEEVFKLALTEKAAKIQPKPRLSAKSPVIRIGKGKKVNRSLPTRAR
jgi:predicted ATP-dependent protease